MAHARGAVAAQTDFARRRLHRQRLAARGRSARRVEPGFALAQNRPAGVAIRLTAGDPALRKLTAAYLRKLDFQAADWTAACWRPGTIETDNATRHYSITPSEIYSPERLLITGGSQQLLYMTTEALCDEGDIVLVEDPTYFVFLGILQSRGLRARAVRLERDGLDLAHLESVLQSLKRSGELRRVKMIYLVSYFQNPTGVTTGFEKKCGVLKLLKKFERAAGHPIYLLEDAAYRELCFPGRD